jgi:hypothetical protein
MHTSSLRSGVASISVIFPVVVARPPAALAVPVDAPAVAPFELRDVIVGGRHGHEILRDVPFQSGVILDGPRLYQTIGREDLARTYGRLEATKVVLVTTGGAAAAGIDKPHQQCGLETTPVGTFGIPSDTLQCHGVGGGTGYGVGIGAVVVGIMLESVGLALDPEPVSQAERRRLVEDYNASTVTAPPSARLHLAPEFSLAGGGLSLRANL